MSALYTTLSDASSELRSVDAIPSPAYWGSGVTRYDATNTCDVAPPPLVMPAPRTEGVDATFAHAVQHYDALLKRLAD